MSQEKRTPSPRPHRFAVLDGWRGICAILVALHHIPLNGDFYALPFVANSYLFVDFFFVLSGFVITHGYADKLTRQHLFADFIIRRFGRLWPLHAAVLAAFVAIETGKLLLVQYHGWHSNQPPFSGPYPPSGIITSLLLVQSLGFHQFPVWNNPSWSVSTEFYTYLIFAVLVGGALFLTRNEIGRSTRAINWGGVTLAICSALILFMMSDNGIDDDSIFRCTYGFFMGHLTYRTWQISHPELKRATLTEFGTLVLVIGFVALAGRTWLSFAAPLVFAFTVWVFAHEAGAVSRMIAVPAVASLGLWSYSIYMLHAFIFRTLLGLVRVSAPAEARSEFVMVPAHGIGAPTQILDLHNNFIADLVGVALLLVVCAAAAITYRFIERPGQVFFKRLARSPAVATPRLGRN